MGEEGGEVRCPQTDFLVGIGKSEMVACLTSQQHAVLGTDLLKQVYVLPH